MVISPAFARPLHMEVADRLRGLILEGELAPGQRLNERLLTEYFNISRTPLREAIKMLSSEGLVQLLPRRGAVVTIITPDDAQDMFEVMGALESLAGYLACERATDRDIEEIETLHEQMREHYENRQLAEYSTLNWRIHEKIVECARNKELSELYKRTSVRLRPARYMSNFSKARWDQAMAEHERILEALKHHDGELLGSLMTTHLRNKLRVVREWFDTHGAPVSDAGNEPASDALRDHG